VAALTLEILLRHRHKGAPHPETRNLPPPNRGHHVTQMTGMAGCGMKHPTTGPNDQAQCPTTAWVDTDTALAGTYPAVYG